jgi:hypothetical protein
MWARTMWVVASILFIVLAVGDAYNGIMGNYQYQRQFGSYWSLAEKAATIAQKSEYIDKFVAALQAAGFDGEYNAVYLKTPDNSFDYNFAALKSLQSRLHQIQTMDITSFQYQTAIQQITAQEQGEADKLIGELKGLWWKENHFWLWNWVLALNICFVILMAILVIVGLAVSRGVAAAGSKLT